MSTIIRVNSTFPEVSSQVCSIDNFSDLTTAQATTIDVSGGVHLFQIIITNNTTTASFVKIWNHGSQPTISTNTWSVQPDFVLPIEANTTADYTFTGIHQFEFATGFFIGASSQGGGYGDSSGATDLDITIFVKS